MAKALQCRGCAAATRVGQVSTGLCSLWVERFAKDPCCLEGRHSSGGDGDGLAAAGIAGLASCAVPCGELPEAGDGDGLALGKRVCNGGGQSAERFGDIGLRERRAGRNAGAQLGSGHGCSPNRCSVSMFNEAPEVVERLGLSAPYTSGENGDSEAAEKTVRGAQCTYGSATRGRVAG